MKKVWSTSRISSVGGRRLLSPWLAVRDACVRDLLPDATLATGAATSGGDDALLLAPLPSATACGGTETDAFAAALLSAMAPVLLASVPSIFGRFLGLVSFRSRLDRPRMKLQSLAKPAFAHPSHGGEPSWLMHFALWDAQSPFEYSAAWNLAR